jgi:hypothetical protein
MVKDNKKVYLHVSDQGASVSTTPLEFIGETISEPTFRDALTMSENQPAKVESDGPAIRHHAKVWLGAERRARRYGSCGHECRHRRAGDDGCDREHAAKTGLTREAHAGTSIALP